jgi:hypothetical protein
MGEVTESMSPSRGWSPKQEESATVVIKMLPRVLFFTWCLSREVRGRDEVKRKEGEAK